MANRILPTPDQLRELLRYDPETGKLFWKERPVSMFASAKASKIWHTRYANKEAFTAVTHGYKVGRIFDVSHRAHRVIWAICYGEWPANCIDHINGERADNRITNLRAATKAENSMNQAGPKSKSGGIKGAYWDSWRNRWKSEIRFYGNRKFLGYFDTPEEANAAYCEASEKLQGEYSRLR